MAITGKLGQFRGESRFTTWACRFVILEVSAKVGRHFWRRPDVRLEAEDWDRLPGRFGFEPARASEWREPLAPPPPPGGAPPVAAGAGGLRPLVGDHLPPDRPAPPSPPPPHPS